MSSIELKTVLGRAPAMRACGSVLAALLVAAMLVSSPVALAQEAVSPAPAGEQEISPAQTPSTPAPDAPAGTQGRVTGEQASPVELADDGTIAAEAEATLPHDLSPWGMYLAADWVVKAVMIGLVVASLVTWTVWLAKSLEIAGARAVAGRGLKRVIQAESLPDAVRRLEGKNGPVALMVRAAAHEMAASQSTLPYGGAQGLKERVNSHLSRIMAQAGRRVTRGTGILASVGSTAPFVGLFGTVWGIMNSFIGISEAQTTNLAVVAPGIAEALLATALGLVAAIPAVLIYNVFARWIAGYRLLLADAAAAVERLVSRDIDRRAVPDAAAGAAHELSRAAE